jgi:phosphate transport system permease protein
MTDLVFDTPNVNRLTTDAAKAHIRARYRAEARFKAYGIGAIALTAVFLAIVILDIVVKGLPAFTAHFVDIEVTLDREDIDPTGSKDPAVIRAGDFQAVIRKALRGMFPAVTDRTSRRQLDNVVSSGAADVLRDRVAANPALVGQTIRVTLLLSDDTDLYYKGVGTGISRRAGAGAATPTGTSGEITILSTSNDFSANITTVKQALSLKARTLRTEADRVRASLQQAQTLKQDLERSLAAAQAANATARLASIGDQIRNITPETVSLANQVKELEDQAAALQTRFEGAGTDETLDRSTPSLLVAINGGLVKITKLGNAGVSGDVLLPLASDTEAKPGTWQIVAYATPEENRRVSDREVSWLEYFREKGLVKSEFNWAFFTSGDSREPELAGIRGALVGSAITMFVTLMMCLPVGVGAAIYLEEFAPKNRATELIEVNINNLAAVPSIVFGLLGLAVFLNFFGLPRSAPLVGGLVLGLLVLPTIIIASRAALRAVPPSIKEAALGVGASHQQAIFHHVLPLAMPGIMTGTIIGMAHALGETAPLLMIGMVAFIVEVPTSITDAATVLPVQIYLWSDLPEIAFQAKTAAAIIVLLLFLFAMNGIAIFLRRRFERRW